MMESLVLTVIGPDKPGVVDALSKVIAEHGASWEQSRMARLAGQFAGILLVKVPADRREALKAELSGLAGPDLEGVVAHGVTEPPREARVAHLELVGGDRPGIVQRISRAMAARHVNLDELETAIMRAPMSSELLFRARARLTIPDHVALEDIKRDVEAIAADLMVDIDLRESAGDDS
jgi:glycine cleavage system regulatory protein